MQKASKEQNSQTLSQRLAKGVIFWDYSMTTWDVCNANRRKGLLWDIHKSCCVFVLAFWNFICHPRKSITSLCIYSCSLEKIIYCYIYLLPAIFLKAPYTVILDELCASQCNKLFLWYIFASHLLRKETKGTGKCKILCWVIGSLMAPGANCIREGGELQCQAVGPSAYGS